MKIIIIFLFNLLPFIILDRGDLFRLTVLDSGTTVNVLDFSCITGVDGGAVNNRIKSNK
jgi:hypothetical protein